MASSQDDSKETRELLGGSERLIKKLHPHVFSFLRYYGIGIALLVWTTILAWLVFWGPLEGFQDWDWFGDALNPMVPALLWFVVALVLGLTALRAFNRALQVLYWVAVAFLLVLTGVAMWVWDDPDLAPKVSVAWGYVDAILTVLTAEVYRRAFSYYVTDMRIIIRYKLFSTNEVNLRFEKIEDWKIARTLLWRILGIGTIRPYTGTEDGKEDLTPGFDAPDECMYGIKDPEGTKKLLVDLVLERDRIRSGIPSKEEEAPAEAGEAPAPAEEAPAPATAAAETAGAAGQPERPTVVYYQPGQEAKPQRNYERVDVAASADDGAEEGAEEAYEESEMEPFDPAKAAAEPERESYMPRTMFPQAREPSSDFQLEEDGRMDFEQPRSSDRPRSKRPVRTEPEDEDEDGEVLDESRPRSL